MPQAVSQVNQDYVNLGNDAEQLVTGRHTEDNIGTSETRRTSYTQLEASAGGSRGIRSSSGISAAAARARRLRGSRGFWGRVTGINPAWLAASADRERAVGVLRAGFTEGRLTQEELDDRVAQAYAARTYGQLWALTADLPAGALPGPQFPWGTAPWSRRRPRRPATGSPPPR